MTMLVPFAKWRTETSLPPAKVAARLRAFLATPPPEEVHPDISDPFEHGGARYDGSVGDNDFQLRARARRGMGYLPVIRGTLADSGAGTHMRVTMRASWAEVLVLLGFLTAVGFTSRSVWVTGVLGCGYHFASYAFGFLPHRNTFQSWTEKLPR
jgi:hypothetical protein